MPQNRHLRFLLALLYLALGATAGWFLLPCLLPFLLAFLLAGLLERPVALLCRLGLPRWAASLLCTLLVVGLLLGGLGALLWRVCFEVGMLIERLPLLLGGLLPLRDGAEAWLYRFLVAAPIPVQDFLRKAFSGVVSEGITMPSALYDWFLGLIPAVTGAVPGVMLFSFTAALATHFISAQRPAVLSALEGMVPPKYRAGVFEVRDKVFTALGEWLRVQGILLVVCFVLLSVGLLLLGVHSAVLIAAAASLLDALPVFGVGLVLLPWAAACLFGGSPVRALCLLALYVVLWLSRSILEPKLMGNRTGIPPVVALLAMYGGFHFFGIPGLILAPIAAIAGWQLLRSLRRREK